MLNKMVKNNWEIYMSVFLVQLGFSVVTPVLSEIRVSFNLESVAQTSLIISSFAFARLLCDLPSGYLIQRFNPSALLTMSSIFVVTGSGLSFMANDYNLLLVGRFLAGGGSALNIISAVFILTRSAKPDKRGATLATYQAILLLGIAMGPALGGLAAVLAGWRGSFLVSLLAGCLALSIGLIRLYRQSNNYETTAAAEVLDKTKIRSTPLPVHNYLSRIIVVNILTFLLLFALEGFNSTIIPLYGAQVLNLQPAYLGALLAWVAVIRLFASFYGGVLSDKYGRGAVLIPTLLISGIGAGALMLVQDRLTFVIIIVLFAVGRMGNNLNLSLLADVTPPDRLGSIIGINRFLADLGLVLGPWLLGILLDMFNFITVGIIVALASWLMALLVWLFFGINGKQNMVNMAKT